MERVARPGNLKAIELFDRAVRFLKQDSDRLTPTDGRKFLNEVLIWYKEFDELVNDNSRPISPQLSVKLWKMEEVVAELKTKLQTFFPEKHRETKTA